MCQLPGFAVAWLKEARTPVKALESGMPAAVIPVMGGLFMATVTIGVDPHKASHTAVAISAAEEPLGELRVRASASQAGRLLASAAAWPERIWAIEGAGGLGYLLARQLLAAGEQVLDVQPKLGARVRQLAAGCTNQSSAARPSHQLMITLCARTWVRGQPPPWPTVHSHAAHGSLRRGEFSGTYLAQLPDLRDFWTQVA